MAREISQTYNKFYYISDSMVFNKSTKRHKRDDASCCREAIFANITVGLITCLAFPIAYLCAKMGGNPESVFAAGLLTLIISELVGVFIVRRYIKFSTTNYILNVHVRCLVIVLLSGIIPYLIYDHTMSPSLLRVIITGIISVISVGSVCYIIGIDKNTRNSINNFIRNKIKKSDEKI